MKKILFGVLFFMFILAFANASAFDFEKQTINSVITAESIHIPASYSLTITNADSKDSFSIYAILPINLSPTTPFGADTAVAVTMLPSDSVKKRCGLGECAVQYYIKSDMEGAVADTLGIKIMPIADIINADMPSIISHDTDTIKVNVSNKESINLGTVAVTIDSAFCKQTQNVILGPKSSKVIEFSVDRAALGAAKAGSYPIKLSFLINKEYTHVVEKTISLEEFANVATNTERHFSFFGYTDTITKKNQGNAPELVTIEVTKNKFENAFTTFAISPVSKEPSAEGVKLQWQRQLEPGENWTVQFVTDYTIPVVVLMIVIIGGVGVYIGRRPRILIKKKAYRIRAKGGEFALKMLVLVKNVGLEIADVKCTDRLPSMAKLYEQFTTKPDKIENGKIEWSMGTIVPGEERVFSYIIYSKIVPAGMLNLPTAQLSWIDAKGKRHFAFSNKVTAFGD